MWTTLLLAALRRMSDHVADTSRKLLPTKTACPGLQLQLQKGELEHERPYKGYYMPLARVATGAYATFELPSAVACYTVSYPTSALSIHPPNSLQKEQPLHKDASVTPPQDLTLETNTHLPSVTLLQLPVCFLPLPARLEQQANAQVTILDNKDHDHPVLNELGSGLFPELCDVSVGFVAQTSIDMEKLTMVASRPAWQLSIGLGPATHRPKPIQRLASILDEDKIDHHLTTLDQAEASFQTLHKVFKAAPAPIPSFIDFGCSFTDGDLLNHDDEGVPCSMPLYRAICTAKEDFGVAEFDPASLVDGSVLPGTLEAEVLENLPEELCGGFITYLQHLVNLDQYSYKHKSWKPKRRLDRDEAEFLDNVVLSDLLKEERPGSSIPYGRLAMEQEYWSRRHINVDTMITTYFKSHEEQIRDRCSNWLTFEAEEKLNWESFAVYEQPLDTPLDLEIEDMEALPVQEVDDHPIFDNMKVFARAYPSWEPEVMFGEEIFPDCAEGDEAYMCLKNYQGNEIAPAFVNQHEGGHDKNNEEEIQGASSCFGAKHQRKDSASPGWEMVKPGSELDEAAMVDEFF